MTQILSKGLSSSKNLMKKAQASPKFKMVAISKIALRVSAPNFIRQLMVSGRKVG